MAAATTDLILDIPGNHSLSDCRRALTPEGTYVLIGHDRFGASRGRLLGSGIPRFLKLLVLSPFVSQDMGLRLPKGTKEHLVVLKELLEAGKLTR